MKKYLLILIAALTLVACSSIPSMKEMTIGKGQSTVIMGIAPTPDVIDFRFELNQYK